MKLTLPLQDQIAPWNRTLCKFLADSGAFADVQYAELPMTQIGRRWRHYHPFKINDVPFALDTWDGDSTLTNMYQAGVMTQVRAIIKVAAGRDDPYHAKLTEITGVPILPWVMFPDSLFPLEAFQWQDGVKAYQGCLAGSTRRGGRRNWHAAADAKGGWYTSPRLPMADYVACLADCQWGVALAGVGNKTRREPEYMSCGMPLALAYEPYYPFPFIAGEHYYRLYEPADLELLSHLSAATFAKASAHLWQTYFKPAAAARLLVSLLAKYL